MVSIDRWSFVAIPGEVFVEYALQIKSRCKNSFVISLANGEMQGYIVTEEAAEEGGYEASNAMFHHSGGVLMAQAAIDLLGCT